MVFNKLLNVSLLHFSFLKNSKKKKKKKVKSLSHVRLFVTPMDCSLPGSSVHGILPGNVLEWVAISFSRASSQPRDQTQFYHIAGRCFTIWVTREAWVPIFSSSMVFIKLVNLSLLHFSCLTNQDNGCILNWTR